jgi:tetratricopeptide (TPR) repeat protein
LEPLAESECELLIRNLIGEAGLAEPARKRILAAAEGNPLFVEETLEMLIDDGLLERRNGSWVAIADLTEVSVPPNIHALLAARLDQLDEAEALAQLSEEAASPGDVTSQSALWAVRARVLARRADFEAAEAAARRAVEIVERSDFLDQQADTYVALAEVLSLAGRTDEAVAALAEALERYERKGNVVSSAQTREQLANLRG